jgi:SAM-dependent MidA family methyltransferase
MARTIEATGPVSFAEFMELALYHPYLGYYARASRPTGRAGDFFTSVDVGPVFGQLLAKQFGEMWRLLDRPAAGFDLVEAGAGNAQLARDVLDAAQLEDPDFYSAIALHLVERSPAARAVQQATLGAHADRLSTASDELPDGIRGVVFANELLDALPTHVVEMTEAGLREVFVGFDGRRFVEMHGEPSTPRIAEYLNATGCAFQPGWRGEVNLAALDWMEGAARALSRGFLVIVDYGHGADELYSASHAGGTLTVFYRHTTHAPGSRGSGPLSDCLEVPGECDITSHVDLTAVTRAAERAGLTTLGRLDQTYFLLGLGLADMLENPTAGTVAGIQHSLALKTLVMPGGLGSTQKVLLFGKGVGRPSLLGCSYRVRLT